MVFFGVLSSFASTKSAIRHAVFSSLEIRFDRCFDRQLLRGAEIVFVTWQLLWGYEVGRRVTG